MTEESEQRRAERKALETKIEFIIDADVIEAQSINLSETGVRFATSNPILIRLRMEVDGEAVDRLARLVWMKDHPGSFTDYGLEFINDPEA